MKRVPPGQTTDQAVLVGLARLRQARGLTQDGLARRSLVPQTNIAMMERGRQSCTATTLLKLADALGCSTDELLGWAGGSPRREAERG